MYNIFLLNIPYSKFISAFLANAFGFSIKKGYPSLLINYNSIKKMCILEIIKSSLGDGLTLVLIYNCKFSPLKRI